MERKLENQSALKRQKKAEGKIDEITETLNFDIIRHRKVQGFLY